VRRDGRWTLPHRLALRTTWCDVMLDLTSAVRSGPELVLAVSGLRQALGRLPPTESVDTNGHAKQRIIMRWRNARYSADPDDTAHRST